MMNDRTTIARLIAEYERLGAVEAERADNAGSQRDAAIFSQAAATWGAAAAILRAALIIIEERGAKGR